MRPADDCSSLVLFGAISTDVTSFICIALLRQAPVSAPNRHASLIVSSHYYNLASPALLKRSSLFMYTVKLLTALCLVLFISSLIGTPFSLLDVT